MQKNKGFTLIELLVVIAIIGILASVVMTSVSSARGKAQDASIKSSLSSVMNKAEIEYDGDYDVVCGANGVTQNSEIVDVISSVNKLSGGVAVCGMPASGHAGAWALSSPLKTSGNWCVDSLNASREIANPISATTTVCPSS